MRIIATLVMVNLLWCCKTTDSQKITSYWQDITIEQDTALLPTEYRGLQLDMIALMDRSPDSVLMLPLPNGSNVFVSIEDSGTMSEALKVKFPNIRSYKIVEPDYLQGRIDINHKGFYAMIIDLENIYFINPVADSSQYYISFDKQNLRPGIKNPFIEGTWKK